MKVESKAGFAKCAEEIPKEKSKLIDFLRKESSEIHNEIINKFKQLNDLQGAELIAHKLLFMRTVKISYFEDNIVESIIFNGNDVTLFFTELFSFQFYLDICAKLKELKGDPFNGK